MYEGMARMLDRPRDWQADAEQVWTRYGPVPVVEESNVLTAEVLDEPEANEPQPAPPPPCFSDWEPGLRKGYIAEVLFDAALDRARAWCAGEAWNWTEADILDAAGATDREKMWIDQHASYWDGTAPLRKEGQGVISGKPLPCMRGNPKPPWNREPIQPNEGYRDAWMGLFGQLRNAGGHVFQQVTVDVGEGEVAVLVRREANLEKVRHLITKAVEKREEAQMLAGFFDSSGDTV